MTPALIDLHVRPRADDDEKIDYVALANDARSKGLDGLVIYGLDDLSDARERCRDTGVLLYSGIELNTDLGPLLCLPRERDEWFAGAGWESLTTTKEDDAVVYSGQALITAFSERGGAVLVAQPFDRDLIEHCKEGAFIESEGLSAVVIASDPKHAMSNDKALRAAREANLPCVAGSAAHSEAEHFGSVATIFATPPTDQTMLVEVLRQGQVWPVEIGVKPPSAQKTEERQSKTRAATASAQKTEQPRKQKQKGRRQRGGDDNRGNRLGPANRKHHENTIYDHRQPDFDPIARLYGIDGQKNSHRNTLSDQELDRVNGNRSRGPDPNVMSRPDFTQLRAERHHVGLLLATIDPHTQTPEDSISLRFALANLNQDSLDAEHTSAPSSSNQRRRTSHGNNNAGAGNRGKNRRRRGRRRRN